MINFVSLPSATGSVFTKLAGNVLTYASLRLSLNVCFPALGDVTFSGMQRCSVRSPFDSMWTSCALSYDNHACRHLQLKGTIETGGTSLLEPSDSFFPDSPFSDTKNKSVSPTSPANNRFYSEAERTSLGTKTYWISSNIPCIRDSSLRWLGGSSVALTGCIFSPQSQRLGGRSTVAIGVRTAIGAYRADGVLVIVDVSLQRSRHQYKFDPESYATVTVSATAALSADTSQTVYWYPDTGWTSSYSGVRTVTLDSSEVESLLLADSTPFFGYDGTVPSFSLLPATMKMGIAGQVHREEIRLSGGSTNEWTIPAIEGFFRSLAPSIQKLKVAAAQTDIDFRQLHDNIMDSVPFVDTNTLAYIRDLRSACSTVKSFISLAKDPTNPKKWASSWLSLRYGDRLTFADSVDYIQAFASLSRRSRGERDYDCVHSRQVKSQLVSVLGEPIELSIVANATAALRPANLGRLCSFIRNAINWDVWPTLQNDWDLIPFSFVVDWFVDVESLASAVDRRILSNYYDVLYVVDSIKDSAAFSVAELGFRGSIDWSWYHRDVARDLSFSPFRCDAGHLSTANVVDGTSLLIQAF